MCSCLVQTEIVLASGISTICNIFFLNSEDIFSHKLVIVPIITIFWVTPCLEPESMIFWNHESIFVVPFVISKVVIASSEVEINLGKIGFLDQAANKVINHLSD